jgi:hypothetical protein
LDQKKPRKPTKIVLGLAAGFLNRQLVGTASFLVIVLRFASFRDYPHRLINTLSQHSTPQFRQFIFYFPLAELRETFAIHRIDLCRVSQTQEIEHWTRKNCVSQQK